MHIKLGECVGTRPMYVRIRQTSLVHSMYSLCALGGMAGNEAMCGYC